MEQPQPSYFRRRCRHATRRSVAWTKQNFAADAFVLGCLFLASHLAIFGLEEFLGQFRWAVSVTFTLIGAFPVVWIGHYSVAPSRMEAEMIAEHEQAIGKLSSRVSALEVGAAARAAKASPETISELKRIYKIGEVLSKKYYRKMSGEQMNAWLAEWRPWRGDLLAFIGEKLPDELFAFETIGHIATNEEQHQKLIAQLNAELNKLRTMILRLSASND